MTNVSPDNSESGTRTSLALVNAPLRGKLAKTSAAQEMPKIANEGLSESFDVLHSSIDHPGSPPWLSISFALFVAIPSLLCLLYFTFVASDQYIAEARFAVRSLADDGANDVVDTGMMHMQSAAQDAFVVTSFIQSNELLRRLEEKISYRAIFENATADFLARFPSNSSIEEFLEHWTRHVSAYIDGPSGIVTLSVRTFKPSDSVELVTAILKESEKLVNEMTVLAREDVLSSFREEVVRTGKNLSGFISVVEPIPAKVRAS